MLAVKLCLHIFLLVTAAHAAIPFWKEPANYKKIVDERQILVSAKTGEREKLQTMSVVAAGMIKVPLDSAYATVTKYQDLPKVSERFHEAKYDAVKKTLFLHMSAMGWHVKMTLKITPEETEHLKILNWESIDGGFKGMKGSITLKEYDPRRTEMSLDTYYESEKLPLPKVLMGIGLEVVTQRVAGIMRDYIEKAYK